MGAGISFDESSNVRIVCNTIAINWIVSWTFGQLRMTKVTRQWPRIRVKEFLPEAPARTEEADRESLFPHRRRGGGRESP
jgi:hypothetical protein